MLSDESQNPDPEIEEGMEDTAPKNPQKTFWILMLGAIPVIFIQTAIRTVTH